MKIKTKLLGLLGLSGLTMLVGVGISWLGISDFYAKITSNQPLSVIQQLSLLQQAQETQRQRVQETQQQTNQLALEQWSDDEPLFVNESQALQSQITQLHQINEVMAGTITKLQSLLSNRDSSVRNAKLEKTLVIFSQALKGYQQEQATVVTQLSQIQTLVAQKDGLSARAAIAELDTTTQALHRQLNQLLPEALKVISFGSTLPERSQLNTFFVTLMIFVVVIIIANLILGFLITRNIVQSLGRAVNIAEEVSAGNLTPEVEIDSNDETGQLFIALKTMTENLNSLIFQVQQSGIQITSSTTQMAASRRQLEETMTEQVTSTNQVTATAQEIANTSEALVKTMEQVADLSQSTAITASKGQNDLILMERTIRQLADSTTAISSKLGIMSEKAQNINSVVLTITKVADQTNLLSLNAAIEAEKAGEYGAGFAVVAREIRRLADQTAVATLEIEQMVKEMQSAVSTGVMEMDKFNREVSNSVQYVGNISGQIAQVIEKVQGITPRFELVSQSMEEQSLGAQQIRQAMEHLSEGSEQTAYSLHDTNNALERLNDAAQGLQAEISVFKVHA